MADNNFEQQSNNIEMQNAVSQALKDEKKKKRKKRLIILGVILVVFIIIVILSSGGKSNEASSDSNSSTTSSVSAEKSKNKDGAIGDFKCVVKKAEITKDWDGKDAVIITYDFTNNANDSYSFDGALEEKIFQDGIELEIATITDDDEAKWFDTAEIKPGVTKEVKKAYLLRNKKSDLEIEISELFSFSDDKITTTVKL